MAHPQHPVSQEQLAANRANAAKFTGPRTTQGKARSAQNARKHGFTVSTFAVVRLEDLLEELPNEPIIEAEPEQNETTCTPSETNPSPPKDPFARRALPPRSPNWSWISPALRVFWKTAKSNRATQAALPSHGLRAALSKAKRGGSRNTEVRRRRFATAPAFRAQ